MATIVNMHEAKTHLSKLVAKAREGEETIIALAGTPVARIVPLSLEKPRKSGRLGFLQDLGIKLPDDIKTPFKKDIEQMFYGNGEKLRDL